MGVQAVIHSDAKSLRERGDRLFSQKQTLNTLWQDIALQFYPERADFTVTRDLGEEFGSHLMTGFPSLQRSELGDAIGSMLRPMGQPWMHIRADREEREDYEAKAWLERATGIQRRAMYDRKTCFTRATKEGDHDFATFGQAVITTEVYRKNMTLLYRSWHLRDCAWAEDASGQIGEVHRNWKPTVAELCDHFPKTVHQNVRNRLSKEPHERCNVRHIVIGSDCYDGKKFRQPWVSMFIDCDNDDILEEVGSWTKKYTIPRWRTLSGSQYAFSPATMAGLPDARLLQAMTLTLLDAGERAANPPMVGVSEAIRGDLNIFPGGFTAVDAEYDERLGEVLRPLTQDKNGIPYNLEMLDRIAGMLKEAFFLNTLNMPPAGGPEMTAYEVGQRVQEYIRQALPLFEPMEDDYNGALCEITFETLMREGAFGAPDTIPQSLRGHDIKFAFESPLHQMIERQKGDKFLETKAMIAQALDIDQSAMLLLDVKPALRDVLGGIGTPTKWLRSPETVAAMEAKQQQDQRAAQMLALAQQGADVANTLGQASQSLGAAA